MSLASVPLHGAVSGPQETGRTNGEAWPADERGRGRAGEGKRPGDPAGFQVQVRADLEEEPQAVKTGTWKFMASETLEERLQKLLEKQEQTDFRPHRLRAPTPCTLELEPPKESLIVGVPRLVPWESCRASQDSVPRGAEVPGHAGAVYRADDRRGQEARARTCSDCTWHTEPRFKSQACRCTRTLVMPERGRRMQTGGFRTGRAVQRNVSTRRLR